MNSLDRFAIEAVKEQSLASLLLYFFTGILYGLAGIAGSFFGLVDGFIRC